LIAIIFGRVFLLGFYKTRKLISYTTEKLGLYVKELVTGQNLGSGRGGDIYYLKEALKEHPVFGIGILILFLSNRSGKYFFYALC